MEQKLVKGEVCHECGERTGNADTGLCFVCEMRWQMWSITEIALGRIEAAARRAEQKARARGR